MTLPKVEIVEKPGASVVRVDGHELRYITGWAVGKDAKGLAIVTLTMYAGEVVVDHARRQSPVAGPFSDSDSRK